MTSTITHKTTRGQVQRELSQKIQRLYKSHIGHAPGKVTCQIIDNTVMVIAEDSLTRLEKLLIEGDKNESKTVQVDVEQVRSDLDATIRPVLLDVFRETLSVEVVDILSDTTLDTGRTAIIAVLSEVLDFNTANK